jgi:hypothetical protein
MQQGWNDQTRPRPTGSNDYESLTLQQRMDFALDVLVPEAILRICVLSYDLENLQDGDGDEAQQRTEQQTYDAAISKVKDLAANNSAKRWNIVAAELNLAQRKARELLGLRSEAESTYHQTKREEEEWLEQLADNKVFVSRAGGRVVKRYNYKS